MHYTAISASSLEGFVLLLPFEELIHLELFETTLTWFGLSLPRSIWISQSEWIFWLRSSKVTALTTVAHALTLKCATMKKPRKCCHAKSVRVRGIVLYAYRIGSPIQKLAKCRSHLSFCLTVISGMIVKYLADDAIGNRLIMTRDLTKVWC